MVSMQMAFEQPEIAMHEPTVQALSTARRCCSFARTKCGTREPAGCGSPLAGAALPLSLPPHAGAASSAPTPNKDQYALRIPPIISKPYAKCLKLATSIFSCRLSSSRPWASSAAGTLWQGYRRWRLRRRCARFAPAQCRMRHDHQRDAGPAQAVGRREKNQPIEQRTQTRPTVMNGPTLAAGASCRRVSSSAAPACRHGHAEHDGMLPGVGVTQTKSAGKLRLKVEQTEK